MQGPRLEPCNWVRKSRLPSALQEIKTTLVSCEVKNKQLSELVNNQMKLCSGSPVGQSWDHITGKEPEPEKAQPWIKGDKGSGKVSNLKGGI